MSTKEWADIYGVTVRTVQNWIKGECPDLEDISDVYKWVANRPRNRSKLRPFDKAKQMLEVRIGEKIKDSENLVEGENTAPKFSKQWWEVEKIRVGVEADKLKFEKVLGEVISKTDHTVLIAELVDLIFRTFESGDEGLASAWEGQSVIKILEGRKKERDSIRNEIANVIEKSMG